MSPPGDDRRRDPRVPLLLRIEYPDSPGVRDATENLSASGIFIRTELRPAVGARLPLLVSFPGLLEPLQLEVEVAWTRPAAPGLPAGVAVRVPEDRPEDRERLAGLVRLGDGAAPTDRTYRILLVEDTALVMAMYDSALRRLRSPERRIDVEVDHARDGAEALARLKQGPRVQLVVTDLYMPVMDGFMLVERMRADPDIMATPVMAISAGGDEARQRAMELGVDVFLQKPVKIGDILGTVRALLRIP